MTREDVIDMFQQAAAADRLLPKVVRLGYRCALANMIAPVVTSEDEARPSLSPVDYEVWQFVNEKLFPLITSRRGRRIVWLRSSGMGWKRIAAMFSLSRNSAKKVFDDAIDEIVKNANC